MVKHPVTVTPKREADCIKNRKPPFFSLWYEVRPKTLVPLETINLKSVQAEDRRLIRVWRVFLHQHTRPPDFIRRLLPVSVIIVAVWNQNVNEIRRRVSSAADLEWICYYLGFVSDGFNLAAQMWRTALKLTVRIQLSSDSGLSGGADCAFVCVIPRVVTFLELDIIRRIRKSHVFVSSNDLNLSKCFSNRHF